MHQDHLGRVGRPGLVDQPQRVYEQSAWPLIHTFERPVARQVVLGSSRAGILQFESVLRKIFKTLHETGGGVMTQILL